MKCECSSVVDFEGPCHDDLENYEDFIVNMNACYDENIPERDIEPEDLKPLIDPSFEYKLAIGNLLEISLFGEEELEVEQAVVATDGNIYYSLLPPMRAEGKTLQELIKDLEHELARYYKNPLVAVNPRFFPSHNFKILGRVRYPGLYMLNYPMTLRDALALAGGLITEEVRYSDADIRFRSNADLTNSFIVREGKKVNVDFKDLFYNPETKQNIYVRPEDYIYIAPISKQRVYVLGAVRRPRTVAWVRGMTLMGALTAATGWDGGYPYSPDINKVLVLRGSLFCPKVIEVDVAEILYGCALDVFLVPGDIVYAQNKTMRFGRELIHIAVDTFINSFGTAAGSYYANAYFLPPPDISNNDNGDNSNSNSGNNEDINVRFRRR